MALRQKQIDMLVRIGLLGLVGLQHLVFDNCFTTTYQGRPAVVKVHERRANHPQRLFDLTAKLLL